MSSDRLFFKLHNGFPEHPKAFELSDKAFRQLVEAWCGSSPRFTKATIAQLERAGFMRDGRLQPHPMFQLGPLKTARPPIDIGLRKAVYDRDGHQCLECGTPDDLTLDHIHPWSLGGTDTYDNLQTLCRPCNSRKGAKV